MPKFQPMLADDADLSRVQFPVLASPKLDGVRATVVEGRLLTRSLKELPNKAIYNKFKFNAALDGELIVGDPTSPSVFRDTMKAVMSHEGDTSELRYYIFDVVSGRVFRDRINDASYHADEDKGIVLVPHVQVDTLDELLKLEELTLTKGYEGLMLRKIDGLYKFGRATVREGTLLKVKRTLQSEAVVIGFVEQMHNANEAKLDNLGYTERSSHQANLVPTGVLGALVVRDIYTHVEFNIGTGFSALDRDVIWRTRDDCIGLLAAYEYLPIGVKDKPRHPVWLGWRSRRDM